MKLEFDPTVYPYPSRRYALFATKGMACTSTPQSAQVGLEILKKGGNAIDAAVAMAACQSVVEPVSNGIGSDAFALVWTKGKLYGLNASGWSPKALTADMLRAKGLTEMPIYGWDAITVPGAPAAWAALAERFGRLSLSELVEPASRYAEEGYPVALNVASGWQRHHHHFSTQQGEEFKPYFDEFTIDGRAPRAGEVFRNPYMANTLREIGATRAESFYRGALAEKIVAFAQRTNGYFSAEDFGEYYPEWVEPISVNYRGYDVCELPPNGHGITVLMALNLLKGFDLGSYRDCIDVYHKQIEAIKLAFSDAGAYVTDPRDMRVKVEELLSDAYADERRKLITDTACMPVAGDPRCGGTIYLCTADAEGNMVSYIQSNYRGFGSGVIVPGTGISLQDRGNNFSLDPKHDNVYAPRKRPYHTIIPGFLIKDGEAVGPFGVMGGFMQPQGHVQMVCNTIDFHLNPQASLDAPRWQWVGGRNIEVEHSMPTHLIQQLADRGHQVKAVYDWVSLGRGQILWRLATGGYCGGVEPRTDSSLALW